MPRARPTKLATVIGALSERSLHDRSPIDVLIVATSAPLPSRPVVAWSIVNGASGSATSTATGFFSSCGGAGGGSVVVALGGAAVGCIGTSIAFLAGSGEPHATRQERTR